MINPHDHTQPLDCFAAKSNDAKSKKKSSSGGIFPLVSRKIIEAGGIVFGARYDSPLHVKIDCTTTVDGISAFQGSKYFQAEVGECFKQVKKLLNEGKTVLYSGTPCQISGLKNFLGKEYKTLFTLDFICHGTPSQQIWEKYLLETLNRKGLSIDEIGSSEINFRDKSFGWHDFHVTLRQRDNIIFSNDRNADPYFLLFTRDLTLMPACYECCAKPFRSGSDLTLGDFWGIEKVDSAFDDDNGCSALMVNSEKGRDLLQGIDAEFCHVELADIVRENPALLLLSTPTYRKLFFDKLQRKGFYNAFRAVAGKQIFSKIYRRLWLIGK